MLLLPVFLLLVLFGRCTSDNPMVLCEGFSEEPTIHFKLNSNDTFGIYFLNVRGIGDTLYAAGDSGIFAPVDMNGDTMTYEILLDTASLGVMELRYSFEQKFCEDQDQLNLYFKTAQFTPATTAEEVSTVVNGFKTKLDTSSGYKSFLNNTLETRYFEISKP